MKFSSFIAVAAVALSGAAFTQTSVADHGPPHPAATASAAVPTSDGEVRKQQGKVTLKHGPISNLDMPAMTMVFKVADPKMLDSLKEGDKVKFAADKVNGAYTVTAIETAK